MLVFMHFLERAQNSLLYSTVYAGIDLLSTPWHVWDIERATDLP